MQIKANGIMLEYEEYGPMDGVPLILIRGLGTTLAHWPDEFMQGFAALGYRTIIYDNRDVGLSQRCPKAGVSGKVADILGALKAGVIPEPAYEFSEMTLDTIGLMDALGLDKAHIFGISMGGGIAQLLAIHHADRLLSDTIVMTAAGLRDPSLLPLVLTYPQTREQAQDALVTEYSEWGSPGYPMAEDEIRALAGGLWDRSHDPEGVNRQALATFSAPERREDLQTVDLPCFVLHGEDDALIPPDAGREIGVLIPKAELKILSGMGHIITPKLAPVIVEMVHDFITRRGL